MSAVTEEARRQMAALHTAAGDRYAAAARELADAWADLLGVGEAASNRLVGAIPDHLRMTGGEEPRTPSHPIFLPSPRPIALLRQAGHQRAADLLASLEL